MKDYEIAQYVKQFVKRRRGALRVGESGPIHNTLSCLPARAGDMGQTLRSYLVLKCPTRGLGQLVCCTLPKSWQQTSYKRTNNQVIKVANDLLYQNPINHSRFIT